ncbi:MAG TPA: cobalamin biosynthesis protein [Syntrophomonadaceae bacterium]|nr:cobalamin biosynthesis protein [Syntrophomonadaceae bacterium]
MIDLLIAIFLDVLIGDPHSFPHPIKLMGKIIGCEEKLARKVAKSDNGLKILGGLIVVVNILIAFFVPYYILRLLQGNSLFYHLVNTYFLYTCIAAGCLHREAMKVYVALAKGLQEARYRVSFIVGRDTAHLNEEEIIKATVETVAENTADGVIAPLLFAMIGGAPLAFVYKMVNTMDSMLGYMNEKYRDIGLIPAKTDDLFNYIPSRLTGILMCVSSLFRYNPLQGFMIMIRDRKNHKSPNCAYPEGAVAGLLGIQLGGAHTYFGELVHKPVIGDQNRTVERDDIKRAITIMYSSEILFVLIYLAITLCF